MACILGVGIATLDIINRVAEYPAEDSEVRALGQRICRGGNATNTLVALSQLGHRCRWAGTLAEEPDAKYILADLQQYQIDTSAIVTIPHGKVPTSYIAVSERTGSRSIIHYRDLAEYTVADFRRVDLAAVDWLHFEARNVAETGQMLAWAREQRPRLPISVEVEKPRPDVERLFTRANVLLFSRAFAATRGFQHAEGFLRAMRALAPQAVLVVAWGSEGAYGLEPGDGVHHCPAFPPPRVIDTLGAGDTFNAGFIDAQLRGESLSGSLERANRLAGKKCGLIGLELGLGRES